ncbi:MAG: SEC-C domain-containing protein [Deltaproteobacteria bacterium]|nr:SEC-C domain-containing protein [Deltaproteobacteria bacterium]MBI2211691.1 SEC-C domain-containing protein [Deltaproteobacteria bacterium]MBI2538321.1 SEC-C domain-containing protein [Deltaproteobacteria bacterium]MBI2990828.1 SEC-C domain-containing protein [Deltaproteobacteria bacterium]
MARVGDADVFSQTGRNDPCPCGSGKKYKRCCLGKVSAQA